MRTSNLAIACAALLALAACDSKQDGTTVGQKVDRTIAQAKTAADEAKQNAKKGLDEAAEKTKEASGELSKKTDGLSKKVGDATITAAIKADLAKDPELSALRVNVDTQDGKVSLYGAAPNEAAKQRAETIAMNEKGVTSVDNKLAIESKK
ncbi:MAG: BON domain-containing protein [Rhizobacter sp.]